MKSILMKKIIFSGLLPVIAIILTQCTSVPEWQKKNKELIKQYAFTERKLSGLPETKIVSNLEPSIVTSLDSVTRTNLYPGVNATLFWGSGTMVCLLQLEPNAKITEDVLPSDRFVFVLEGEIEQLIEGSFVQMISKKREEPDGTHSVTPRVDFVYLEKGNKNALNAGSSGALLLEVYSPVRLDYLQKAGVADTPTSTVDLTATRVPNVRPNLVYNLWDLQLTELAAGANSRLVTGKSTQLSFLSMDPGAVFDRHLHPEEQMMLVLRGGCSEMLLDGEQNMSKGNVVLIPGNMVHGAKTGDLG
ncbi:MAG: cupin domain-containing protein, partial [Bacteroidales bacterium]|nr:cupin domain-containing protein [Bacteroidales bacterium]